MPERAEQLDAMFPKLDDAQIARLVNCGSQRRVDIRAGSMKRVAAAVGEGSMAVQFVHKVLGSA